LGQDLIAGICSWLFSDSRSSAEQPIFSRVDVGAPIRLVLAGRHLLILEALEALFREAGGFEVVARCRDGEETLAAVPRMGPDVLVVELQMPRVDGLEVLRRLGKGRARTPVVLLVDQLDEREALEALRLGVGGVILKQMPASSLVRCIRAVHAGEPWLERRSAARMIQKLVREVGGQREAVRMLTPREIEVVRMVGRGLRNRGIAEELGTSESTVKSHLGNIYAKLGTRGRLDLFRFATDKGLT
jgi:two-component system, NarL family, nitrate/nitrite response regulator NarL